MDKNSIDKTLCNLTPNSIELKNVFTEKNKKVPN